MNFYIGNSIEEVIIKDVNVEFSDDLIEFIYKLRKQVSLDLGKLYKIDPYKDVNLPKNSLPSIIEICSYILNESLLQGYEEEEEGYQMLQNLIDIAEKAITRGLGLISIGD